MGSEDLPALETTPKTEAYQPVAALDRFIEQMGLMCESDNLPRIAGRVFGLFLIEGTSLSLVQIADRLGVSRASASTNTRMLAEIGVLERVGMPGDRQDYYQLAPNPYHRLLTGVVIRMKRAHAIFAEAAETWPADRPGAKRRVQELASFYRAAAESVDLLLQSLVRRAAPTNQLSQDDPL